MKEGKKSGSHDVVLEGWRLVGVFFAVVFLCALFFSLGFVLGRNEAGSHVPTNTASAPAKGSQAAEPGPKPSDLTFYKSVEGKPTQPAPAAKGTSSGAAGTKAPAKAATQPIYLQVAALSSEAEAKKLVAKLYKLGFSAVIRPPEGDKLYRVQVGPLATAELADAAQRHLEMQGFHDIVRR